jgi:hypothetical protein
MVQALFLRHCEETLPKALLTKQSACYGAESICYLCKILAMEWNFIKNRLLRHFAYGSIPRNDGLFFNF